MPGGHPLSMPFDEGFLDVGDGDLVHWEVSGNPEGKPAVLLHGGPGSGSAPGHRRYFDPDRYRIIQFDQRGCGRSTPSAADPDTELSTNTTHHLIADLELLRAHLGVERWLLWGGSWGVTLALAYAERYPHRVIELVLLSVTMTRPQDVHWLYHGAGRFLPAEWARFREGGGNAEDLVAAYDRLLNADPDPEVRARAARSWCAWEDAVVSLEDGWTPDPRYQDPAFRMTFARMCAHYFSHTAWLQDGELLDGAHRLAGIPGVLVHGRFDLGSPAEVPWLLAQAWPDAELHLVDTGHRGGRSMSERTIEALDRFADKSGS